jgi:mercuric ion transport protein
MAIKDEQLSEGSQFGPLLMAAGGLLGALAASSCCTLPLVLFGLGVSGAWIGNFTQLAPYQPAFIAATVSFLACGYWLVHR